MRRCAVSHETLYSNRRFNHNGKYAEHQVSHAPHERYEDEEEPLHDPFVPHDDAQQEVLDQAHEHQEDHSEDHAQGALSSQSLPNRDDDDGAVHRPVVVVRQAVGYGLPPPAYVAGRSLSLGERGGVVAIGAVPGGGQLRGSWRAFSPMRLASGR